MSLKQSWPLQLEMSPRPQSVSPSYEDPSPGPPPPRRQLRFGVSVYYSWWQHLDQEGWVGERWAWSEDPRVSFNASSSFLFLLISPEHRFCQTDMSAGCANQWKMNAGQPTENLRPFGDISLLQMFSISHRPARDGPLHTAPKIRAKHQ